MSEVQSPRTCGGTKDKTHQNSKPEIERVKLCLPAFSLLSLRLTADKFGAYRIYDLEL